MNNQLKNTYNQISDVFSKSQIKNAVESLKSYHDRLKLIDTIIDRRQEIIQANDFSKISKYAQTFTKMIIKHKNHEENDIAMNQRFQMQMVINKFLQKNLQNSLTSLLSPQEQKSNVKSLSQKKNFTFKKPSQRTNRYFSSLDSFNNRNKRMDRKSDEERDILSLQQKIKQSVILKTRINQDQYYREQENNLKQYLKQQGYQKKNKMKQSSEPVLSSLGESEQYIQTYKNEFKVKVNPDQTSQYVDQGFQVKNNQKNQIKREIFDKSNIILCSINL